MLDKDDSLEYFLDIGSQLTGGAGGALVGYFAGGAPGAAMGAASGILLTQGFKQLAYDLKHRLLGDREKVRVGSVFYYSLKKIKERLEAGDEPRDDGFFEDDPHGRSAAKEILEGILLAAQKEYEEKKIPYYGNLLANIAFNTDIDRGQANFLIRLADSLSYRQLCFLAIYESPIPETLRDDDYEDYLKRIPSYVIDKTQIDNNDDLDYRLLHDESLEAVLQEIYDLLNKKLLVCYDSPAKTILSISDPNQIRPSSVVLSTLGLGFLHLMGLYDIELEELEEVAIYLKEDYIN